MKSFAPIKSHISSFRLRAEKEGGVVFFAAATVGCLSTERERVRCSTETHTQHACTDIHTYSRRVEIERDGRRKKR